MSAIARLRKLGTGQGNPRIVKRTLNVVRMRARLARRRGIPLDEALIAKLALFERCTDETATAELYRAIQESAGGKPDSFRQLEKLLEDPEGFAAALPEAWKGKHAAFVADWFSLEPRLSGEDLRPALYLSRETQALRIELGARSPAAEQALRLLLRAANTTAPSARKALASTPPTEHPALMEAIIDDLRKHEDWKTRPRGFDGALILAEISPEAGKTLGRFLRSAFSKPPPWLVPLLKNKSWYEAEAKR